MTNANSEWRLTGDTDVSSFTKALSRSFTPGASPVAAEAEAVYATLRRFGLTRLGAAFLWHETKNGSWNCSTAPQGSPCIPRSNKNPFAMKTTGGGWAVYDSYAEAAETWADRLLSPNGPYRRTGTLKELVDVYAPSWDGNDVGRYVETVAREIDALPLVEEAAVEPSANPFRRPTIHALDKDFARYGLTRRQADKIIGHRFQNRNGQKIAAIVLHIQEGTTPGSLSWWASGNADASSSVMVQKDGTLLRVIEDRHGPWTNGDTNQPTAKGRQLINRIGSVNPNLVSVTVEAEGYSGDAPTEAMVETICWMVTEWMTRHGLTMNDIYRHGDLNSVTRSFCPGKYHDVVMERLRTAGQPGPGPIMPPEPVVTWPGKPPWLDERLIPLLFPEATPEGIRTRAWLAYCGFAGRAPARKAFLFRGTPDELIQFDDGLLVNLKGERVGDPR